MAKNTGNPNSPKPLNWRAPQFAERVEKSASHADRCEEFHRQGTPITRRGAFNGVVPNLAPNPYVAELNPPLILKSSGEGSRGGKVIGHTQAGNPIYESSGGGKAKAKKAPKLNKTSVSLLSNSTYGTHYGNFNSTQFKAFNKLEAAGLMEMRNSLAYPTDAGKAALAAHKIAEAGTNKSLTGTPRATDILKKAVGTPTVPLRPQAPQAPPPMMPGMQQQAPGMQAPGMPGMQAPGMAKPGMPPQGPPGSPPPGGPGQSPGGPPQGGASKPPPPAQGGAPKPMLGGQTPGQQAPKPPQPPGAPDAGGSQTPGQLAQPSIPGVNQLTNPQQTSPAQSAMRPIGYTADGQPIYADPFHPAHQAFGEAEHAAAAQQHMGAGDPQAAQVHNQLGADAQSPMDRAQGMMQQQSSPMPPGGQPAGGRTQMPGAPQPAPGQGMPPGAPSPLANPETKGTQQPYGIGASGQPDEGKPQAPPQMGPDRNGPKPGMHEVGPGEEHPQPGQEGGSKAGLDPQMAQLVSWLEAQGATVEFPGQPGAEAGLGAPQGKPGNGNPPPKGGEGTAPSPGASSEQQPKGSPGLGAAPKQTGAESPMTNAGNRKTPIEPTAQKSLFSKFGW
jgi:hypothetical protein